MSDNHLFYRLVQRMITSPEFRPGTCQSIAISGDGREKKQGKNIQQITLGLSVSYTTLPVVLFPSTKAKKIFLELIHAACFEFSERNRKQSPTVTMKTF